MNDIALATGIDIPISELQVTIHQPTIMEISYLGEQEFFTGLQYITVNKNMLAGIQDNSVLDSTSNFQIFMTIMQEQEIKEGKKQYVINLLQLIFPEYKISFTPRSILLIKEGNTIIIDENNFNILQEYLRAMFCINSGPMDQHNFNPGDAKAREIAEKLMRGRQKVAAEKGELSSSVFARYISILTVGLNSMSYFDVMKLTMYQLYDLIERYTLYLNWDLDIRTRLAGGKPDDKPQDWMKNIH